MEIRARYLTIGMFTLAVIAAGFLFVYWLYNSGGLGRRDSYQVIFKGPVSGLFVGSPVTFNGLHVGEVTGLELSADQPQQVFAKIGVQTGTPVKTDTTVGLDFQGLTGASSIALSGGSANSHALSMDGSTLTADADASQSMTQAARTALLKLDGVLNDNADPLKSTIGNLNSFTTALARNSDRVDSILAGLERMTGGAGKKAGVTVVDLSPPRQRSQFAKPPAGQIAVLEPTALGTLDTNKLVLDPSAAETSAAEWSDALPKLMQARLVQSFENAGLVGSVMRGDSNSAADYQLQTDLRVFRVAGEPSLAAEFELSAKLVNSKGRILAGRIFKSQVPLMAKDAKVAEAGLNDAFGKAAQELIGWTIGVVAALPPPKAEDASTPAP